MKIDRRQFLRYGAAAGVGLLAACTNPELLSPAERRGLGNLALVPLLDPLTVPKFVNPLPNPLHPAFIFQPVGGSGNCYEIGMRQFQQNLLGPGFPDTTVWGYGSAAQPATYPGRTFEVRRDQPVEVQWLNQLVDGDGDPLPHLLPVDESLHRADYTGWPHCGVPVVPHLHGGHTESASDGLPEYWWTPGEVITGPRFVKSLYTYDNDQEAGTLWYHDHALGITRLNVYAGLAGFYLLRDEIDTGQPGNPLGLPAYPYEIPIVIQDRLFTAGGQLFYPYEPDELEPGYPPPPEISALPEFFGDVMLVNGVAWPYAQVEPRKYRLRLLNGSDSRFYNLWIDSGAAGGTQPGGNGPMLFVIGTDDGFLNAPVPVDQLTIGPGERYDVIVDFAGWSGQTLVMRNNARSPFPKGGTVDPRLDGLVMAFNVGYSVTRTVDNTLPDALRGTSIAPRTPDRTRGLILFEGIDQFGRLQPMLGTVEGGTQLWDGEHYFPITENPALGTTELWEVYNATADAHPVHLHLVTFQLLNRQGYKADIEPLTLTAHDGSTSLGGKLLNIDLRGRPKPAEAYERGPKDTAIMYPGEVTRVVATFDRPGRYVWHCHILSHEDHEMMRPYHVGPLP